MPRQKETPAYAGVTAHCDRLQFPIPKSVSLPLLAFILSSLWLGCAGTARRPALSEEETRWEVVPEVLRQNFELLKTLKGRGKLIVESPDLSYSADSRIVFKSPDSLYLKVEAILGIDIGWFFSDRQSFTVYTPFTNAYYTGSIDSFKFGGLLAFEHMTYDRLLQALIGLVLIPPLNNGRLSRSGKSLLLSGTVGSFALRYWIDPGKGVVTRAEMRDKGDQLILSGEFQRFIRSADVYLPRSIRLQRPVQKQSITMFYDLLEVNKEISKKEFKTKIPENATRMLL